MTFDPLTFLAQLLNFAALLVLLRAFLYRPVLAVMRRREEITAAALEEARRRKAEAEEERRALAAEREAEARERAARLATLEEEVERLRRERLEAVDREAREARAARSEALAREVERAVARLAPELARLVVDEVSETIDWLSGADADGLAVARFLERLRGLPPGRREELRSAAGAGPVRLVTARALEGPAADEARRAVADALGVDCVELATDPGLLAGAALEAGGLRLDGSAAARLAALPERFARARAGPRGDPDRDAA